MVKKTAKRQGPAKKRAVQAPVEAAPAPTPAAGAPDKKPFRLTWIVVALGLALMFGQGHFSCKRSASDVSGGAPSAPAQPKILPVPAEWGKAVKLKKVGSLEAPPAPMDLYVDAKGIGYAVEGDSIHKITDGKITLDQRFGGAPNRSITGNGDAVWITNSDGNAVFKFKCDDLTPDGVFALDGASRLLGITWLPGRKDLALEEVGGGSIYIVNANGKKQATLRGTAPKDGPDGFTYDLSHDPSGHLFSLDLYNGLTGAYSPEGKLLATLENLDRSRANRRLAAVNGRLYLPSPAYGAVLIMDYKGNPQGWFEADAPNLLRAGDDGFLYLLDGKKFLKLQPL